tara:strand:- start:173 stop:481 length:309 start_codon:yes stop_codon:yes gene_type:complete
MKTTFKVILVILCNLALAVYAGYTLSVLWSWFVIEALGVQALSIPEAVGVLLIVQFATHQYSRIEGKEENGGAYSLACAMLIASFMKSTIALVCGFVVLQFY